MLLWLVLWPMGHISWRQLRMFASQFHQRWYETFLTSKMTSCSFQGTFSLIIEAWNAESPKEQHSDYTGGLHSMMESKYTDIKVFYLFVYSINLSSLIFSLFFHNRESKQPDQSFSNTKALGDWRRLVSGCSFWRPERASLLVSCFLWWVLLRWGMFGLLPSSWWYTGTLHLRWERKQGMPGGMAGRLLFWPWVPPVCVRCSEVCLVLLGLYV